MFRSQYVDYSFIFHQYNIFIVFEYSRRACALTAMGTTAPRHNLLKVANKKTQTLTLHSIYETHKKAWLNINLGRWPQISRYQSQHLASSLDPRLQNGLFDPFDIHWVQQCYVYVVVCSTCKYMTEPIKFEAYFPVGLFKMFPNFSHWDIHMFINISDTWISVSCIIMNSLCFKSLAALKLDWLSDSSDSLIACSNVCSL